jgi:peroxiredoxin Q/BCP
MPTTRKTAPAVKRNKSSTKSSTKTGSASRKPAEAAAPATAGARGGGAGLAVGSAAPPFTALDQDEQRVSLAELRGHWVVLYFYPRDDTPGCTVEACDFTDGVADFASLDALVLGCSPDSPASHRRFIEKHRLRVRLLSDPERELLRRYGAWGEKVLYGKVSEGVIRSTVIIDPAGRVAHHWPKVSAKGHAAAVQARLRELRDARSGG